MICTFDVGRMRRRHNVLCQRKGQSVRKHHIHIEDNTTNDVDVLNAVFENMPKMECSRKDDNSQLSHYLYVVLVC